MDAARLIAEAAALIEAGRLEEAEQRLAEAQALEPHHPEIAYRQGLIALDRGSAQAALERFDTTVARDPGHARAHNNRGSALLLLNRASEAEAAFRNALGLDATLSAPRLNLGQLCERAGRHAEARTLYTEAIQQGIEPGVFTHHLAALDGATPPRADDAWVRATFDNFAPRFDTQLQDNLGYRVPEQLVALLHKHESRPLDILDLGCGTGLIGAACAGRGHRLTGVDLSPKMLTQAQARGCYDRLDLCEVHALLAATPAKSYDAILAADLLIYIGALEGLFTQVARVLRPGAWLAFSIEEIDEPDYALLPSGRYGQSQAYVARLAKSHFATVEAKTAIIRTENDVSVQGHLYLFRRREAQATLLQPAGPRP